MPGVTGLTTTFSYANYTGELTTVTPTDTRFLSIIGGLTGGGGFTNSTIFGWQEEDLRAAAQNTALEGAEAPTESARTRFLAKNVVQILHESVGTSYTRMAATQQLGDVGSAHPNITGWGGANPVTDEHSRQIMLRLKEVARDVNFSFLRGVYVEPANNSTARSTKGMMNVPATNITNPAAAGVAWTGEDTDDLVDVAGHGLSAGNALALSGLTGGSNLELNRIYYVITVLTNTFQLALKPGGTAVSFGSDVTAGTYTLLIQATEDMVLDTIQDVWDNGGMMEEDTALLIVNSTLKRRLTDIFITGKSYQEVSRNIAGVSVTSIETDFGKLNILMDRHAPHEQILLVSAEQCEPVYLLNPEFGFLFEQELALTGSKKRTQLYGEIGLRFGNELTHGVIQNVAA